MWSLIPLTGKLPAENCMIRIMPAAIACLLLFAGCSTTSKTTSSKQTPTDQNKFSKVLLDSVEMHAFHFEWLTGKAKVEVLDGAEKTEFTASLRIRYDSAIWISISPALGLEAARVLLTSDSIHIIDRINNERLGTDYFFFQRYTSFPVSFVVLQDLIKGAPLYIDEKELDVSGNDSAYFLHWKSGTQSSNITLDRMFRPVMQNITDSGSASINILQQQYDIPYTSAFSLWRKIEMMRPQQMQIIITFSKIKINEPVKLPFNQKD